MRRVPFITHTRMRLMYVGGHGGAAVGATLELLT